MNSRKTPTAASGHPPRTAAGADRPGMVRAPAAHRFSAKLALQRAFVAAPTD